MSDIITSGQEKVGNRERSTSYPAINLQEAIEYSAKLISAYPRSSFDRISGAKAMGYDSISGASAPKIAALVHYGLLERKGNSYKNSELAGRIHDSISDQEKKDAIIEAVRNPKLFSALITEYTGFAIPPTLGSILIRQYGISRKVAEKTVKTFKESAEFATICQNGVFQSVTEPNGDGVENGAIQERTTKPVGQINKLDKNLSTTPTGYHSVTLPSGAILSYPSDIAFHIQTNPGYQKVLSDLENVVKDAIKIISTNAAI